MIFKNKNLIIGTIRWVENSGDFNFNKYRTFFEECLNSNYTIFDTAPIYGKYTLEKHFGTIIKESKIKRESFQIISKFGIEFPFENNTYTQHAYNLSKQKILESVNKSLKDLQLEYLDFVLVHRPSPIMNFSEIADTIIQLKEEQKVMHFGVSNFNLQELKYLRKYIKVESHQIEFSLNNINALHNNLLNDALVHNYPTMIWSPFGEYFLKENHLKKVIEKLAVKYNTNESAMILKFLSFHPSKIIPIVGTTNIDRLKEYQNYEDIKLENADWFYIYENIIGKPIA